jgi:hypothetical protein
MPLKLTEHDLQVHVFDVLRLNEKDDPRLKWIYAVPNGNYRSWKIGAELKLEGVKKGISDICIPFPGNLLEDEFPSQKQEYPGAYIEMKSESGAVSPEQNEFLQFVAGQGFATLVAFHYDPALDFIEEYCGIKLRGRERLPRKI